MAGGVIRVWFGGGDVASPDENLHGKIGVAILRPIAATGPQDNGVGLTH
jgi:hypothetical protein